MGWFSWIGDIIGDITGASGVEDAARESAEDTRETARRAEALNRERYGLAQGYMTPYVERSETAAQQFQAEMGLPGGGDYTARDMSDIPGYQAVMDESLRAVEQSAVSSGSTAYGGRRLKAAGEVGANVTQSYYNNYMNMLQNLSSPTVATNLSSIGMNQGIQMGQQNIAATNQANQYMMEGAGAKQAGFGDLMGGISNVVSGAYSGGYI